MKNIFYFITAFSFGVLLVLFFSMTRQTVIHNTSKPMPPLHFSLAKAPSESLQGVIMSLSGDVLWQSRTATESVHVTEPRIVQQGEMIETEETGFAAVQLPAAVAITISPNTKIDFIQTLPVSIVLNQSDGEATYVKLGTKYPISVRIPRILLTDIDSGSCKIALDAINQIATIAVVDGQSRVAFNDASNVSNVITLERGAQLVFDEHAKTYSIL